MTIGDCARASRRYNAAPYGEDTTAPTVAEGDPSYVNAKVLIEDGKISVYRKWNTETDWQVLYENQSLSSWDSEKTTLFAVGGMEYIAFDDITVKTPAWGVVTEDDCKTNASFVHSYDKYYPGSYIWANSNGFVYMNRYTSTGADHYMIFDYGVKGNVEFDFDLFMNDIDYVCGDDIITQSQELRTRIFLKDGDTEKTVKHTANTANGWNGTLAFDDAEKEALNIGTYARASRKYGIAEKNQDTAPEADGNPTHVNFKIVVEDGYVTTYRKWNTESSWIKFEGPVALNEWNPDKYETEFVIGGMTYMSVSDVVVKAPVYDSALIPGVNPNSMKRLTNAKVSYKKADGVSAANSHVEADYVLLNDCITDDFIVSYDIRPTRFEFDRSFQLFFGTDSEKFLLGDAQQHENGKSERYNGRIGLGSQATTTDRIVGWFSDQIPAEATVNRYGTALLILGEEYLKKDTTYNIMISFVDNNLKFGIRKADGTDTWHYISKDYAGTPKAGHLVWYWNGAAGDINNSLKVWVPKDSVEMKPTIAQADGEINAAAKIADYSGSESYVQPKLITALYKTGADGSKKLCGLDISDDSLAETTVKTLTGTVLMPTDAGNYEVKAMVWNSLDGVTPLTGFATETITVAEAAE